MHENIIHRRDTIFLQNKYEAKDSRNEGKTNDGDDDD